MAKPKKKGKKKKKAAKAKAEDGIRLAAFHWLAMRIEQIAIELYVTDRDSFDDTEDLLRRTVRSLNGSRGHSYAEEEEDCPDGYVRCRDGLCAPMCDDDEPPNILKPRRGPRS